MALKDVLAIILGGGAGSRLYPLTKLRSKPAVPIGGKYRLIDIPISNCINAGIDNIYVLTQFMSASLHRHIHQTYRFDVFSSGYVHVLAAQQSMEGMDWYQGTADAVRKQLGRFVDDHHQFEDILILSGDHLYRMDYGRFIRHHRRHRADVTIAVQQVSRDEAPRLGILRADNDARITDFHEKPSPDDLDGLESLAASDRPFLASMGIYVFRREVLRELLDGTEHDDFGRDVLPAAIRTRRVFSFPFHGYWADIGTIRTFYEANLGLTAPRPRFNFYDPRNPIFTRARFLPSTLADGCDLRRTVIADGCQIHGAAIRDTVIGLRSVIGADVRIERTVTMGADFYETAGQKRANAQAGIPDVGIGAGSRITGALIDKNARIGRGVVINPRSPDDADEETELFVARDGVVVIPKNTVIPDGTVI